MLIILVLYFAVSWLITSTPIIMLLLLVLVLILIPTLLCYWFWFLFFFSSRRRHTRCLSDWSSDVCSSDLSKSAPYEGFHGMDFEEESGTRAFLLRARREGLRDFGACMAPMTAFQILQGIETLHVRMPRHIDNTRAVVAFLEKHPQVEKVIYPELASHPDHELCKRLLPKGAGAVFAFEIKGGRPAGRKFIESLRVFSHLANVGDAKSLVIHPATTTHYRMSDADLAKSGIRPGTVRLSVGLEAAADLIEDLERALRDANRAAARA